MEQKRKVFFTFVALYMDKSSPQELIAAALQYVIIPMFAASFDKGEGDEVTMNIDHLFLTSTNFAFNLYIILSATNSEVILF